MPGLTVSVSASDLSTRMQDRLRGLASGAPATIVWEQGSNRVLIYVMSLRVRAVDGWLVCNLDLQSDATQRQTLQIVFFLGTAGDATGTNASCTINAPSVQVTQLANQWGAELQRVLWDAMLDAIEAAFFQLEAQKVAGPFTLRGFVGATDSIQINVLAGES